MIFFIQIRERKELDQIGVVIFSSSASASDKRRSLSLGAFAQIRTAIMLLPKTRRRSSYVPMEEGSKWHLLRQGSRLRFL
jgi:hypothetical protein